jgi:hypothetical protein
LETKKCSACEKIKNVSEFSIQRITKKTHQVRYLAYCKDCRTGKGLKWYHDKTIAEKRGQFKPSNQKQRQKIIQQLHDFLSDKSCVDCHEGDSMVLQFHHLERNSKNIPVFILASRCRNWERVLKEIKKCVILCANCHIRRHAKEDDWFRFRGCSSIGQSNRLSADRFASSSLVTPAILSKGSCNMNIKKEHKDWIDAASYEQLLRKLRFSPAGDPLFVGDAGAYFQKVMGEKKILIGHEAAVAISKSIGWQK